MKFTLTLLVVVLVGVVAYVLLKQKGSATPDQAWPFYAKKPLSNPEQVLYFRLVETLPDHIVLAQVQLSRLLGVKKGHNVQSWNNRINRMSADFVVCAKDASILAVVELDDASHKKADRQDADARTAKALDALPDAAAIKTALLASPSPQSTEPGQKLPPPPRLT
jgi:hypothetical protein